MNNRDQMILDHLPQVKLLAQRLHRRCPQVELEDLISAGTVGLIRAVDRFDPSRKLKLRTLAEHRIQGALLDYLRQIDPLPRTVRAFQKRRDAILSTWERSDVPTQEELAVVMGLPLRKVIQMNRMIVASNVVRFGDMTELQHRRVA